MQKKMFFLLFFAFLFSSVFSQEITYKVEVMNSKAFITSFLLLESKKKVNFFQASVLLPEKAKVLTISDSKGEIKDYSVMGKNLNFQTNYSIAKKQEMVKIEMVADSVVDKKFAPLNSIEFSFPGFEGKPIIVEISVPGIIAFETLNDFNYFLDSNKLVLQGKGASSVKLFYSSSGMQTKKYVVFNFSGLSDAELYNKGFKFADRDYWVLGQITGLSLPFKKIPVVVLKDHEFEKEINSYSEGLYRTGGIIVIKESAFKENAASIIIHESIHAINAQVFSWNASNTAWFDEGTAKLGEFIEKIILKEQTPNLFNEKKTYYKGNTKYILSPYSDIQLLFDYYDNNKDFMLYWHPSNADETTREFGYTFAELFVKEFVINNGFEGLRKKYKEFLKVKKTFSSPELASQKILSILQTDLKPCFSEDREKIKQCIKKVNNSSFLKKESFEVRMLGNNNIFLNQSSTIKDFASDKIALIQTALENLKQKTQNFLLKAFLFISKKTLMLLGGETIESS